MLKFRKTVPYLPDPVRSRPYITEEQKRLGGQTPPHAVPYHCKPWVDGQTVGWTLFYGYLTSVDISGTNAGNIEVANLDQLVQETQQTDIVSQFAKGHFGVGSGYTLVTPPGYSILILPSPQAPDGLEAITGLIESDWYPRQLFLVFKIPDAGNTIQLQHKTPLVRVVVVPRHEELSATPLSETESAQLEVKRQAYLADESTSDSRWQDANGHYFTHVYKQWSAKEKNGER